MSNSTRGECNPAFVPVAPWGCALGAGLAAATLLVSAPQILKIIKMKSSEGVQPLTMSLMLLYTAFNMSSMVIVKWRQFPLYASDASSALAEQLDLLQNIFSMWVWGSILGAAIYFQPYDTCRHRFLALSSVLVACLTVAASAAVSAVDPCGPAALAFSEALSYVSGVCVMVAFLPQLLTTWRHKAAGSLSLIFTAIQIFGCTLVAANQLFVDKNPWVIWVPGLTSAFMQLLILILASYYQLCGTPTRVKVIAAEDSTRTEALLDGASDADSEHPSSRGSCSPPLAPTASTV